MEVNPTIFREYDIRGLAESELTPQAVFKIGQAYGTFLSGKGESKALIGGDVRLSTPVIRESLIAGLTSVGVDIIDIGTTTTPQFYYGFYNFVFFDYLFDVLYIITVNSCLAAGHFQPIILFGVVAAGYHNSPI